jgi:hypothetical protein
MSSLFSTYAFDVPREQNTMDPAFSDFMLWGHHNILSEQISSQYTQW